MDVKEYSKFLVKTFVKKPKLPTLKATNIFAIDYEALKKEGIELLIFDYDDTLTGFHEDLSKQTIEFLHGLSNNGFKLSVISNFPSHRQEALERNLKDFDLYLAESGNKPNRKAYLTTLQHFNIDPKKALMIGDRLGADLYGAYISGIEKTIMVEPYSNLFGGRKPSLGYRILRSLEKIFY